MGCSERLGLCLLILALAAPAQTTAPPYDPNDPEGIVNWPNGRGRYAWKRAGSWKVTPLGARGNVTATAAERQAMTATLDALSAVLRATPEGSKPVGYFMLESRGIDAPGVAPGRPPYRFSSGLFPFHIEDVLTNGKFVQSTGGETESVYFEFNLLPGRYDRPVIAAERRTDSADVEFYPRPRVTATFAGFPVVEAQDLMIARAGRDPWAPAAYGRVLKAALALYEKDAATAEQRLAGLKKQNDEAQAPAYEQKMREQLERNYGALKSSNPNRWQTRAASMERELAYNREQAGLRANPKRDKDGNWYWNAVDAAVEARRRLASITPAEAALPACYAAAADRDGRYAIQGMIAVAGSVAGCEELVTDSPDYFDRTLGRGSAQLLLVRSMGRCATVAGGRLVGKKDRPRISPPQGCQRHVPIWEAMDWAKVGALLAR